MKAYYKCTEIESFLFNLTKKKFPFFLLTRVLVYTTVFKRDMVIAEKHIFMHCIQYKHIHTEHTIYITKRVVEKRQNYYLLFMISFASLWHSVHRSHKFLRASRKPKVYCKSFVTLFL